MHIDAHSGRSRNKRSMDVYGSTVVLCRSMWYMADFQEATWPWCLHRFDSTVVTGSATRDCAACKVTPPCPSRRQHPYRVQVEKIRSKQCIQLKKKLHHGIHGITAEGCRWTEHNGGYRFRFCVTQLEKYVVVVVSCHPRFLVPWNRQRKLQWSVLSLNLFMFVCHCSNVQAIAFVTFTRSESGKWKKWSMCYKNYIRIT